MKKICFITAVPGTATAFLKDHMAALREQYRVYYVSNEPDESKVQVPYDGYQCVDIHRNISVWKDLKALFALTRYFRKERFDAVHSVTPKAGLLTALAGWMARVPVRIHIFTGQVWANKSGVKKWLLKSMDRLIARLDTHILVDGEGQKQFLINNNVVVKENKSTVLGNGSICGVNLKKFYPSIAVRESVREELNIDSRRIVFVFLGRLNRDKGLYELLSAFDKLVMDHKEAYLLLVGGDEENVSSHFSEYTNIIPGKNFCYYGKTDQPQRLLQAGDVFVLPTYREGFGISVIEASALGLPIICSDAYGVMDAMVDKVTGLRCKVGDVESLQVAMREFVESPDLMRLLGNAGRERVLHNFDGAIMTQLWVEYYEGILPS